MKRRLIFALAAVFGIGTSVALARHFWRGEILSVSQVKKKWGEAPFDANAFRDGDSATRAKMAFSLLKIQRQFKGMDRVQVRGKLGKHDGFYFSDMFPAYLIEVAETSDQDSWQVVFLLDRNEKVEEIVVHKNCCDR